MDSGVPLLPGTKELVEDDKEAIEIANDIGYPVIVKAAAGGGGRGMRVAHNEIALVNGFMQAKTEAATSFKDDGVYVEKYLERGGDVVGAALGLERSVRHGHVVIAIGIPGAHDEVGIAREERRRGFRRAAIAGHQRAG